MGSPGVSPSALLVSNGFSTWSSKGKGSRLGWFPCFLEKMLHCQLCGFFVLELSMQQDAGRKGEQKLIHGDF